MNPEDRLDKLECELSHIKHRYRRLLGGVLIIAVVAVVLIGKLIAGFVQSNVADVIVSHSFILLDEQGNGRAFLNASEGGLSLFLFDAQGKPRVRLASTEGGLSLDLIDAQGKLRVLSNVSEEGPSLTLFDAQGKLRSCP